MRAGRYAQLEEEARSVVRAHPKCAEAWLLLGIASSSLGRDALHPLATAAGLLPNDPVAQLNYGNALGRNGLLDEAAARYEQALNLEPANLPRRSATSAMCCSSAGGRRRR